MRGVVRGSTNHLGIPGGRDPLGSLGAGVVHGEGKKRKQGGDGL